MIRSAPTPVTPLAVSAELAPQAARPSLALVSDAALPSSIFETVDADVTVIGRDRGIAPLLTPGLDAVLFDLGTAGGPDFDALGRIVSLGPDVPVIALFESPIFSEDAATRAIETGAEDACIFDPFNPGALLAQARLSLARFTRRERSGTATDMHAEQAATAPVNKVPRDPMTVVQETADAMVILDHEGRVAFANSAAADLLGLPLETLAGKRLDMPTTPGDKDVRFMHPSGEERFADLRIVETEWGGRPARVAALTDTTVRRRLEKAMRDAEKKGLTSERRSKSFFSNVNHDLRTPLTHIIGFSEIMKDQQFGPLSERYREYARDIHQSGTMLLDMIEDILSVAESESDAVSLSDDICDLGVLIDTAVASQKKAAQTAGIELLAVPSPDLPGFRGDARRLRQGLYRLIAELVHTADEGARIELGAELCSGGLMVKATVEVKDGGELLLPYDDLEEGSACAHVEDPFVSAEGRSKPRDNGLALSLTRKVVEMHGGALHVGHDPMGKPSVMLSLPSARLVR